METKATSSKLLEGDPIEAVKKLKDEVDGEITIHGSATLAQSLIENDLVDEIRLMVFPGRARRGEAALRRDERQEADEARRREDRRRRGLDPHLPARLTPAARAQASARP